jgi:hypothetical protein
MPKAIIDKDLLVIVRHDCDDPVVYPMNGNNPDRPLPILSAFAKTVQTNRVIVTIFEVGESI